MEDNFLNGRYSDLKLGIEQTLTYRQYSCDLQAKKLFISVKEKQPITQCFGFEIHYFWQTELKLILLKVIWSLTLAAGIFHTFATIKQLFNYMYVLKMNKHIKV